jgi:hypothetical protein
LASAAGIRRAGGVFGGIELAAAAVASGMARGGGRNRRGGISAGNGVKAGS